MTKRQQFTDRQWVIILAGGEGERVSPLVRRWLGCHRPKQYCAFAGTRSMFQHTVDRARQLVPPERIVAVIAPGHRADVLSQLEGRAIGTVLIQPRNCDTAPGAFLPLTHIRRHDPDAMVTIFPSDHFVTPEAQFLNLVQHAFRAARKLSGHLILLAAEPDRPEPEYGWLEPGATIPGTALPVRTVRRFVEKPDGAQAARVMEAGGLWNTLVLTATLDALWTLGWRAFPELMPLFERLQHDPAWHTGVIEDVYERMPSCNLSTGMLQQFPEHIAVLQTTGLLWSDWGSPERIVETLARLGTQPTFPLDLHTQATALEHDARQAGL